MNKEQELILKKAQAVEQELGQTDHFNQYILHTLDNFAYRYLEKARPAEILSPLSPVILRVFALENGIKEAVKIKNQLLRSGIGELVKKVSKNEGPTMGWEMRVTILERTPGKGGRCEVSARISFGHPDHNFVQGTYVDRSQVFSFEDDIHFRNTLARYLDEVCELFS